MDGFLVQLLSGVTGNLVTAFIKRNAPRLFGPGFRKIEDEAKFYRAETRQTILLNLGTYVNAVDSEVDLQLRGHQFSEEQANSALNAPTVQRMLSAAAFFAAANDDTLAVESLANLVVSGLQADPGTRISQIVRLSERALEKLRPANLRQLAFLFAFKRYAPSDEAAKLANRDAQLDIIEHDMLPVFEAFSGTKISDLDALVLEEAGVLDFRPSLSGSTNNRFEVRSFNFDRIDLQLGAHIGERPALRWFISQNHISEPPSQYGPRHFALTVSGLALGYITLMKATGQEAHLMQLFGNE